MRVYVVAALLGATGATGYAAGARIGPFAPDPALVWGGEEFSSRSAYEQWLTARGRSYGEWARDHPAAAAKLERRR